MKNAEVIEYIHRFNGNLSAVARAMGKSRTAVYNHVKKHRSAMQALEESRETMKDNAESVFYKKVLDGDTTSLIFFLKTQARDRGYTERHEVEQIGETVVRVVRAAPNA